MILRMMVAAWPQDFLGQRDYLELGFDSQDLAMLMIKSSLESSN
jgi:hypothetical protein